MPIVEKVKKNSDVYDIRDSRISDISSFVTLNGSQTLNAKTLINPVIQSGTGTNDKITVEGKIQSANPVKLESELISFKPISIQYSSNGTESGADGRAKWTVYPTSSNSGAVPSKLSLTVSNDGGEPVIEIGREGASSSNSLVLKTGSSSSGFLVPPVLEKYNGDTKAMYWNFPYSSGTLALSSEVASLASTVSSNYTNTVKKNDSGLQTITGSLSVSNGITSSNYKTTSAVSGTTYGHTISAGIDHIDYSDNYYKPYLRFTTEGTFARGTVNPHISLGTYISNYNIYSFIRGLSPDTDSGEADYVTYILPQVNSGDITETTLLCTHDLQDRFYAPTTSGTTSQVLMGNPSGEPQWKTVAQALSLTKAKIYKYELIVDYEQYTYSNLIVYTTMDLDTSSLLSQFKSNYNNLYYFLAGTAPSSYGEKIGPAYVESNNNGLLPILYVKRGSSSEKTVSPYAYFGSSIAADAYPPSSIATISKSIVNLDLK